MSLKPVLKTNLLDILKKEGMPPIIDKTFLSIWETFAKTQPNSLTTSTTKEGVDTDFWGNLERTLVKFGVSQAIATKTVNSLKKKFGDSPDIVAIKAMMS